MDGQGFSREVAFSQSVINIGADQGNDIVLRGSSVADFHVLMHYDSGRWSISSLNGAYRTTVNGRSLDVEGTVLQNGSIVEIGTYRLTMMLNGVNTDIIIQSQSGADVSMSSDNIDADQNIQLEITKMDQTELEAGSAVEMELTVTNAGPLVANMQLQLQGIPSAWVQIIPPVLNLNEVVAKSLSDARNAASRIIAAVRAGRRSMFLAASVFAYFMFLTTASVYVRSFAPDPLSRVLI